MKQIARSRLQKLREQFAGKDIDSVIVAQPENRRYLSGFIGSAGYLLVSGVSTVLATDFRYTEQAGKQAPDCEIVKISGDLASWLPDLLSRLEITRIGFESGFFTYAQFQKLRDVLKEKLPSCRLVPVEGLVEALRAIKDPEETELIGRAAATADHAFKHVIERIRPGLTENQVAWELEKLMREHGSEVLPFDIIVAAGPNSAMPHAHPTDRPIGSGEPVVIDLGARVEGYCSDMTRTICLGAPDATFKKVYDTVLGAQLTAIATIRPGMTGEQADRQARVIIQEAGYGDAFGHSLGHGAGLATHELPRLGPLSSDVLKENMVFSIEPGIYLPGGGVRIEDIGVLQDGKIRLLSKSPKT